MEPDLPDNQAIKARTRLASRRRHQGSGHWHVRVRSSVVVCRECEARIPPNQRAGFCPECGAGKTQDGSRTL